MTASRAAELLNWRRLGSGVLVLACLLSGLVLISGIPLYPLFDLAVSNLLACPFLLAIGLWLGASPRMAPWLSIAVGNGAIITALLCWVWMGLAAETPLAGPLLLTAAVLFLFGYGVLAGWLLRQIVNFAGWRP